MSASCASRSTTFPLPSSPHWAPSTTVTLLPGTRETHSPLGMAGAGAPCSAMARAARSRSAPGTCGSARQLRFPRLLLLAGGRAGSDAAAASRCRLLPAPPARPPRRFPRGRPLLPADNWSRRRRSRRLFPSFSLAPLSPDYTTQGAARGRARCTLGRVVLAAPVAGRVLAGCRRRPREAVSVGERGAGWPRSSGHGAAPGGKRWSCCGWMAAAPCGGGEGRGEGGLCVGSGLSSKRVQAAALGLVATDPVWVAHIWDTAARSLTC